MCCSSRPITAWSSSTPATGGRCTAANAFYHHGTLDGKTRVPRILKAMENFIAFDRKRVQDNHSRLAELHQRQDAELLIVCAHDPTLYELAKATSLV